MIIHHCIQTVDCPQQVSHLQNYIKNSEAGCHIDYFPSQNITIVSYKYLVQKEQYKEKSVDISGLSLQSRARHKTQLEQTDAVTETAAKTQHKTPDIK